MNRSLSAPSNYRFALGIRVPTPDGECNLLPKESFLPVGRPVVMEVGDEPFSDVTKMKSMTVVSREFFSRAHTHTHTHIPYVSA